MIKQDCFSYVISRNECTCLKTLLCRSKECPFYKTRKKFEDELKKYPIKQMNDLTSLNPYKRTQ